LGKSRREQENHRLNRKRSIKRKKKGNGRMTTLKKAGKTRGG
jgi:hypothetical protein